jgi:hypothetical protein
MTVESNKIILLIYSVATIFHLAYLGVVLMDPSTDEVDIF